MGDATALCVTVRGHVQGVWYRDWTVKNARLLGLTGWVRNQDDGTVAALLQGPSAKVRQMITRMHDGPPEARVEEVAEQACDAEALSGFQRH